MWWGIEGWEEREVGVFTFSAAFLPYPGSGRDIVSYDSCQVAFSPWL